MPMSWARVSGYNVENERTVMVGQVSEERLRAYDAMLRARDQIFKRLRPGAIFEDLYFAAMKEYEQAGFGSILPAAAAMEWACRHMNSLLSQKETRPLWPRGWF